MGEDEEEEEEAESYYLLHYDGLDPHPPLRSLLLT